jgi:hypothetical protein
MAKPILAWLDANQNPLTKIQFSANADVYEAVVADTESVHNTFMIANNFTKGVAAATDVYDATNCQIKVVASDGTLNAPAVSEKWLAAKCLTGGDAAFTQLGGTTGAEVKLTVTSGDPTRPGTISGRANDGTTTGTGQFNVAKIESYIKPILNTTAEGGLQAWRMIFVYSYGAA